MINYSYNQKTAEDGIIAIIWSIWCSYKANIVINDLVNPLLS